MLSQRQTAEGHAKRVILIAASILCLCKLVEPGFKLRRAPDAALAHVGAAAERIMRKIARR